MTATVARSPANDPLYVVAIVEDISARKQTEQALRETEERSRLLIESATDYAIFAIDEDNIIDSWNKGAENVFGYEEKEILGKSADILFTPEDRAKGEHIKEIETARRTGRAEDERWHIRKDGTRFTLPAC